MQTDALSFFEPVFELTVGAIAQHVDVKLEDNAVTIRPVSAICPAANPIVGGFAFVSRVSAKMADLASCSVVICRPDDVEKLPAGPVYLAHAHPQLAYAQFITAYLPSCLEGIKTSGPYIEPTPHAGATIAQSAMLEEGVYVAPGAVIGAGAQIGRGTRIGANAVIGNKVCIGRHCMIGSNVAIQCALIGDGVAIHPGTMIGQDGFGYFPGGGSLQKMPHIGRVIIQDRVELGANVTIDRGTIGDTVIGEGTKIDNLVQVAHNVQIGRYVILCGHVGISGSCRIDDGAMLGGGVGLADGLHIGAGAQLAGASGVMNNVPAGERWAGSPAQPMRDVFREIAALRKLAKGNTPS
ncbi:MAG: UDP-3-O-(3-hydroxymyristoyl)glucosamine N-acyltransferase [Ahrensia sp.]